MTVSVPLKLEVKVGVDVPEVLTVSVTVGVMVWV